MTSCRLNAFCSRFVLCALVLLVAGSALCTVAASAASQATGINFAAAAAR